MFGPKLLCLFIIVFILLYSSRQYPQPFHLVTNNYYDPVSRYKIKKDPRKTLFPSTDSATIREKWPHRSAGPHILAITFAHKKYHVKHAFYLCSRTLLCIKWPASHLNDPKPCDRCIRRKEETTRRLPEKRPENFRRISRGQLLEFGQEVGTKQDALWCRTAAHGLGQTADSLAAVLPSLRSMWGYWSNTNVT